LIVFLDSGIGGLSYLDAFKKRNPNKNIVYVADRKNFPYGTKTKAELVFLLTGLVEKIKILFCPSLVVLACNTASVSSLAELRARFPELTFVGTVPALKPALISSRSKRIAVLGTGRTVHDGYIGSLAQKINSACAIIRIAAPELVEFVEYQIDSCGKDEKMKIVSTYINLIQKEGADGLVLGCTHFLFLLDEFKEAARPNIQIFDSIDGVCRRVENLLGEMPDKNNDGKTKLLIVNGDAEQQWLRRAENFGLELRSFSDFER